jgi:CelD/BcsL family acetyltransferase involved in cellulose biosynthesis
VWDLLDYDWAPAEHPFTLALRGWARQVPDSRLVVEQRPPSAVVELPATWDEYLKRLDGHDRSNLRRLQRRLEDRGSWEHEVFEGVEEIDRALDVYLAIEARSWKRSRGEGIGRSPKRVAFYRDLLARLARRGCATVSTLKRGEERVSGRISIRLGETEYGVQTTYDPRHKDLSPGTLVKSLCMQRAIARGVRRYELLALFSEDKRRWAPVFQPNLRIVVRSLRGPRRRALAVVAQALRLGRRRQNTTVGSDSTGGNGEGSSARAGLWSGR